MLQFCWVLFSHYATFRIDSLPQTLKATFIWNLRNVLMEPQETETSSNLISNHSHLLRLMLGLGTYLYLFLWNWLKDPRLRMCILQLIPTSEQKRPTHLLTHGKILFVRTPNWCLHHVGCISVMQWSAFAWFGSADDMLNKPRLPAQNLINPLTVTRGKMHFNGLPIGRAKG